MSFLLRAALVIGVLSYLAAARQGAQAPSVDTARLRSAAEATAEMTGSLAALAERLPPEAREGAARAAAEGLARHLAGLPPSADTLTPGDRLPPWRGTAPR